MKEASRSSRYVSLGLLAAAVLIGLAVYTHQSSRGLGHPAVITGYCLLGLMVGLGGLNLRKRLSMVPVGRAAIWVRFHSVGGVVALGLFFLHSGTIWPLGPYEQALTVLFYLITASGIFGYAIQRVYPQRLTQIDEEVIYERIPNEVASLREEAESLVLACTEETGSDTLSRYYLETMAWYFRRPRFFLNHALSGQKARHWARHHRDAVQRYLNDAERGYLDKLMALADHKTNVDYHYALQSIMKRWLLIHVPLSAAIFVLAIWHLLVVHVYAL